MATIKATCPECGDVELTTRQMKVLVCANDNQGSYAFVCPECHLAVAKPAEQRVVDVLVASGVRLSVWELPAELDELKDGPAINHDDILAFHFAMQESSWFEQATAGIRQRSDVPPA